MLANSLENDCIKLFKWFEDNQMKANKDKCHFLTNSTGNININVDRNITEKSICEKFLGVNVDYKLTFNENLDCVLKKADQEVNALSIILPFMNFKKTRILINSFFS